MGIEPTWPAWEAGALPLCYTRATSLSRNGDTTLNLIANKHFASQPYDDFTAAALLGAVKIWEWEITKICKKL